MIILYNAPDEIHWNVPRKKIVQCFIRVFRVQIYSAINVVFLLSVCNISCVLSDFYYKLLGYDYLNVKMSDFLFFCIGSYLYCSAGGRQR